MITGKTAQDIVPEYAERVGLDETAEAAAERLAEQFGRPDAEIQQLDWQPDQIAVGCVYAAATIHQQDVSRLQMVEQTRHSKTLVSDVTAEIRDGLVMGGEA